MNKMPAVCAISQALSNLEWIIILLIAVEIFFFLVRDIFKIF